MTIMRRSSSGNKNNNNANNNANINSNSNSSSNSNGSNGGSGKIISKQRYYLSCFASFVLGIQVGVFLLSSTKLSEQTSWHTPSLSSLNPSNAHTLPSCPKCHPPDQQYDCSKCTTVDAECPKCPECTTNVPNNNLLFEEGGGDGEGRDSSSSSSTRKIVANNSTTKMPYSTFPPPTVQRMFVDYLTVHREDFLKQFDFGIPVDDTVHGGEDVMLFYSSMDALPSPPPRRPSALQNNVDIGVDADGFNGIDDEESYQNLVDEYLSSVNATQATENCQTLKIVLIEPNGRTLRAKRPQCLALVPQWESPYVYKFMRLPQTEGRKLNPSLPLRYVSRSHRDSGRHYVEIPEFDRHILPSLSALSDYTHHLSEALTKLRAVLMLSDDDINNDKKKLPWIVQTCNRGQSDLLINFVCSVRARNLDLSRLVLFATDEYTLQLCHDLDLPHCFYDSELFGDIPEKAAAYFGDTTFARMMMAKVYCVHLILSLGYSVLFQDVDMIWYKNPLEYLMELSEEWDVIFQDDGARTLQYAPYSPNSGFYYVRHSAKTVFLFSQILKMGDVIAKRRSHQHALQNALNEHISLTGLKVKVFKFGKGNPFPGGVEFHRRHAYMKDLLIHKTEQPYIFHMCWTEDGIVQKKKYFQQMGEWRVVERPPQEGEEGCRGTNCCLPQPNITCHFRDMPSIIPCQESPPFVSEDEDEEEKYSFW